MLSEENTVAIPQVSLSAEVTVRFPLDPEENHVAICYSINEHAHDMMRTKDEPVGNVLRRIAIKVDQALRGSSKKKKKALKTKGAQASLSCEAKLLVGGQPVDETLPNMAAWVEGAVLAVGPSRSTVRVNPPSVSSLAVSQGCMVDFAIVARAELASADPSATLWTWKRLDGSDNVPSDSHALLPGHLNSPVVGRERIYCPTLDDVGHCLVVECTPVAVGDGNTTRGGNPARAVTQVAVAAAPVASYPFFRIHQHHTPTHLDADHLRVVSYNILADVYATSDYARETLYPYCTHGLMDPLALAYRQCLIGRELLGYHADVVCLQELGDSCNSSYLEPLLDAGGFSCHYKGKEGKIQEGVGVALRRDRLQPVEEVGMSLSRFLLKDPSAADLLGLLRHCPRLLTFLASKTSVVLVVIAKVIQPPENVLLNEDRMETDDFEKQSIVTPPTRYVAVGNTHLFYHPKADHIRLLQAHLALMVMRRTIERFRERLISEGERNFTIAPVFAGDFNSSPLNGVHEYVVNGSIPSCHDDWKAAPEYETMKYDAHQSWLAEQGTGVGDSVDIVGKVSSDCTMSEEGEMCPGENNHAVTSGNLKPTASTHPNVKTPAATASNCKEKGNVSNSSRLQEKHGLMHSTSRLMASAGIPDLRTVFNSTANQPHPELFPGIDLKHSFNFLCASGLPMYTNFTAGYVDTLDYIFADSDHFVVAREIALPAHEDVTANTALPSVQFPSDHLALVCDLKWKR